MAGETIREVVIRARLQMDKAAAAPLRDVKAEAADAAKSVETIGASGAKAAAGIDKTAAAQQKAANAALKAEAAAKRQEAARVAAESAASAAASKLAAAQDAAQAQATQGLAREIAAQSRKHAAQANVSAAAIKATADEAAAEAKLAAAQEKAAAKAARDTAAAARAKADYIRATEAQAAAEAKLASAIAARDQRRAGGPGPVGAGPGPQDPNTAAVGKGGKDLSDAAGKVKGAAFNLSESVGKFVGAIGLFAAAGSLAKNPRVVTDRIAGAVSSYGRGLAGDFDNEDVGGTLKNAGKDIGRGAKQIAADVLREAGREAQNFGLEGAGRFLTNEAAGLEQSVRFDPEAAARNRRETDQATVVVLQEQLRLQNELQAAVERKHKTELDAYRKEEDAIRKRVEELNDRIGEGRQAFGLQSFDERQTLLAIVDKIAAGGIGSLRQDELESVRGNPALAGLVKEFAEQNADASGFEEVLRKLGLDRRQKEEAAKLEATVNQIATITINTDSAKVVAEITAKMDELNERLIKEALAKLQAEFRKNVAIARANLN